MRKVLLAGLSLLVLLAGYGVWHLALSRPYNGGELAWSTAERWGWYGLGLMAILSVAVIVLNPYSGLYQSLRLPWPGRRGVAPVEPNMIRNQRRFDRVADLEMDRIRRTHDVS